MAESATIVRHGATEWSVSGQHTSTTDLPLLPAGEQGARDVATRLAGESFAEVLTSPLRRARHTAELVGYPAAEPCDDLIEWRYGDYEGRTTAEIRESIPGWTLWTHGAPGGERAEEVAARCDRVIERIRQAPAPVLLFAHGHVLRVLTARWLGLEPNEGRLFRLDTSTVSVLGHERETPALLRWNA